MFDIHDERDKLTKKLSEQYSQNRITMDEYERILEYIHKVETRREITIIEKIIRENNADDHAEPEDGNYKIAASKSTGTHLSMFSWRTSNLKPMNGDGGNYISLFGANRILVDNLPKGTTVLKVNSLFGLTEIVISQKVKIRNNTVSVFSGVFSPVEAGREGEELPELCIAGKVLFGNITIKTIEEAQREEEG
jgi:hypothetical protein